ncbi:MAG: hypothetical protein ACR2HR_10785 [Euzebya sp.]
MYTLVMALLFPAVFLTALATRARRPHPRTRPERIGWRITLTGYGLFGVGVLTIAPLLFGGARLDAAANGVFLAMMLPGLLLSLIGSTVIGIVFLRSGHRPRLASWLLAGAFPLWILGSVVLGHNSFGILPLFFAWSATGWRARRAQDVGRAEAVQRPLAHHP